MYARGRQVSRLSDEMDTSRRRHKRLLSSPVQRRRSPQLEHLEPRVVLTVIPPFFDYDFGDAPNAEQSGFTNSYPTLVSQDGARHGASGPIMGASRDVESDGHPTAAADGDDTHNTSDEDGVTFVSGFLAPGDPAATIGVDLTASPANGLLNAWIDFNADGDWDDSGEQIFTDIAVTAGRVNTLSFAVPATAELGPTFARFRVNSAGRLGYTGWAADGEVEDYRVSIAVPPNGHGLFPGEQFPVGGGPHAVEAADLNGDGIVDLVTANRESANVSVLMGLGDGTYARQVVYAVGRYPSDVAVADLDGDGDADIVVANWNDADASVLINRGDGTFAAQVRYDAGEGSQAVALGDLNGDGNIDIVVANGGDRNVSIFLGYGRGSFGTQVTYAVGTSPWGASPESVALADLNADGYLDIVTANDITDDVSVLFGYGNGAFAAYESYPVGRDPNSVALADVNNDGLVDIITSQYQGNVSVLQNLGNGAFGNQQLFEVGSAPISMAASDINQDGNVDILVGYGGRQVAVLLGMGDGGFREQVSYFVGAQPEGVLPVDVNSDGNVDIVTTSSAIHNVSVLLGKGNGTFPLPVTEGVGDHPRAIAVAELSGDSFIDVVTVNNNAHTVSVLRGLGGGSFAPQVSYPVGKNPTSVALADLNGDGLVDIVTANPVSDDLSVLLGVGDGTFGDEMRYGATDAPLSVAVADLNDDGHLDLVAANTNNNNVSVLLGVGDGTFSEQVSYPVGYSPYWVALADINSDGRVDIATVNNVDDNVSVLLGLGDGTFAEQVTHPVGDQPYALVLADLNGDGHVDVVTANLWDNNISVLLGNGDGTFASQVTYVVGQYPTALVADDLNGDGYLDVMVANYNGGNLSVLLGMGDGTFAPQTMYAAGSNPNGLAVVNLRPTVGNNSPLKSYPAPGANEKAYALPDATSDAADYRDVLAVNGGDDNISVLFNQRRPENYDFGDAPDPRYPTLLASDGARHAAVGPTLGATRDTEDDALPNADADGDDLNGASNDEDGVSLLPLSPSPHSPTTATVTVDLQNADPGTNRLDAWIDWNQDGDWDDDGEQIFFSFDLGTTNGVQVLSFNVPQDAGDNVVYGTTYARFRLSTSGGLLPSGLAEDGEVEDHLVRIQARVVGRHVFYNRSSWDGNDSGPNADDDKALATDKMALLPEQTATFVNYTSYSRGINGIMVDIMGLTSTPSVSDFQFHVGNSNDLTTWMDAPAPQSIDMRVGAGVDGSDRVSIIWADNAIQKQWLQIVVLSDLNGGSLGLVQNDLFYFGNAIGESGDSATHTYVNATDEIGARNNPHGRFTLADVEDVYDYNRDRYVNATDEIIARNNPAGRFNSLARITPPLMPDGGEGEVTAATQSAVTDDDDREVQPSSASDISSIDGVSVSVGASLMMDGAPAEEVRIVLPVSSLILGHSRIGSPDSWSSTVPATSTAVPVPGWPVARLPRLGMAVEHVVSTIFPTQSRVTRRDWQGGIQVAWSSDATLSSILVGVQPASYHTLDAAVEVRRQMVHDQHGLVDQALIELLDEWKLQDPSLDPV